MRLDLVGGTGLNAVMADELRFCPPEGGPKHPILVSRMITQQKQLRWYLFFLIVVATGLSLAMASPSVAQDAPPMLAEWDEADAEQAIAATVNEAHGVVQDLLEGNFSSALPLITKNIVPAIISLALIFLAYIIATATGRLVGATIASKVDETLGRFFGKLVANGLLLVVFLGVLGYFGIDVTSFAAIIAASGFAIGMALQGSLSNFAAGIMLLVFRPFKVGDLVRVTDCEGIVSEIDLFTTRLNTPDNLHLILPNGQVFGSVIHNFSHNGLRRVDVNVGVSYAADIQTTREVLSGALAVVPGGVLNPGPQVVLMNLGDSAVNWQTRVWTRPENYLDVREHVTGAVKEALDAANISIPFPHLDIHVVNGQPALRAA